MAEDRILYCHCAYARIIPDPVKREVLERLLGSGREFDAVPDLCEMSARKDPRMAELIEGEGALKVVACYPRAVQWLFHAAGVPLPADAEVKNMRREDPGAIVDAVNGEREGGDP